MNQEEEQIARAIALSLGDQKHKKSAPIIEIHDSDSESDVECSSRVEKGTTIQKPMKKPFKESKTAHTKSEPQKIAPVSSQNNKPVDAIQPGLLSSFLTDRAQMERDRLARQQKLGLGGHTKDTNSRKRDHEDEEDDDDDESVDSKQSHKRSKITSPSSPVKPEDELFWSGACRPIANMYAHPRKDGKPVFRLSEIIGKKDDVQFAIISTFSVDTSWIYQFFDRNTPVVFINPPSESGDASIKNILPNWIKTTPFLRGGRGCMHVKLLLLWYRSGRLRIVIPTANLLAFDWKEIDNFAWLQDVPLRSKPIPVSKDAKDDFASMLQHTLHGLNVKPALETMIKFDHPNLCLQSINEIRTKWDFSKVKAHLVSSLAGKHEGWPDVNTTGHSRLMSTVINMGFKNKDVSLECQGSSMGTYTTQWLNEFYHSACGKSAGDWLEKSKKRRESLPLPPIKILFPTKETVMRTTARDLGAMNLFYRRSQWQSKNCPQKSFYESKASGGPTVMHTKMIIATFKSKPQKPLATSSSSKGKGKKKVVDYDPFVSDSDSEIEIIEPNANAIGWVYIGSHNFTPSAWGNMSGTAFCPILNILNYELGVVLPLQSEDELEKVCVWERPPKQYGLNDEPWMREESLVVQEAHRMQEALLGVTSAAGLGGLLG